jgi:fructose-1,6-bisphosphatase/inositol monophosphatase family enzyme
VAVRAAREAGEVAMKHRRAGVQAEFKGVRDVVTAADREAQSVIAARIAEAFPDDGIVGEEGSPPEEAEVVGRRRWYVDPIDGTSNYLKGRYWWGVSIGFCDADDVLSAGAVYLPALGELYTAARGRGAACNGEPIRCSSVTELGHALCSSGFPGAASHLGWSNRNLEAWRDAMGSVLSLRVTGAVAPDWCAVAAGRSDASWTLRVGRWDIAAGIVIAREAGARVTDLDGADIQGPATAGVAAAPGIHGPLLELLAGALGGPPPT